VRSAKSARLPGRLRRCCASLASTLREHQSLLEISLQRRRRISPQGSPPTEATRFRISLALFFVQLLSQHHDDSSWWKRSNSPTIARRGGREGDFANIGSYRSVPSVARFWAN